MKKETQLPPGKAKWGMKKPENPLIVEIISHAKMQLLKISKHLNYLGYTDRYVPTQRYKFLFSRAKEYSELAIQTELRYIQFKKQAEDQEYQTRQLAQDAQLASYPIQIGKLRGAIAQDRMKQADLKIEAINRKIQDLMNPSPLGKIFGGLVMAASMISAGFTGGASLAVAGTMLSTYGSWVSGEISKDMDDDSQLAVLRREKQAVAIDKTIAAREGVIADLETAIAKMRQQFIYENLTYLQTKEMNQDLYYALAKTLKRVKRHYLDMGIQMGYLSERALAFEMDQPGLQFVKFDYDRAELKNLMAGDFLLQDLMVMEYNRVLSLKQRNHVKHIISLREQHPIEFVNFIQTGRMNFTTGLYEFDKAYPGTYQRRLRRVEVVIQGLVGPEGFKGNLTNFGSFLVRTKDGTLESSTIRLVPTEAELKQAYKNLSSKGLSSIEVGGVHTYQLSPARLVLSKYDIRQDGVIFPAEVEVRETFEDFGVSGLWRLELP
ncbi:MAG: hypothetical protein ACE5JO_14595, partial [Candidatus Binatia bacterium]